MPRQLMWLVLGAIVLVAPSVASADVVCPGCSAEPEPPLSVSSLVDLVLTTVLKRGLAVLLAGAATIVGLPWAVAGVAVAAMSLPDRFRSR